MSKTRNLSDLLDANGDVKSSALDNVPATPDEVAVSASAPSSPSEGDLWYDTTNEILKVYNATETAFVKIVRVIPTLDAISGNIINGATSNLTLSGTGFLSANLIVAFTPSGGSATNVTVTPASDTSAVVAVPSAIYGQSIGTTIGVKVTNSDNRGSNTRDLDVKQDATGGTEVTSGGYTYHTFTSSGNFVLSATKNIEYIMVAGGGSSGRYGGGGGAGGMLAGSVSSLAPNTYAIVIGAGGVHTGGNTNADADNGDNTTFNSLTAIGGGKGATGGDDGFDGGSGGGGSYAGTTGGNGTAGQGNNGGGSSYNNPYPSGGGGGKGAAGGNASSSTQAGNGGDGINTYSAWATATSTGDSGYYAGGGAGGVAAGSGYTGGGSGGTGGQGGGGNGGAGGSGQQAGQANTGGGGGSGAYNGSSSQAFPTNGGSGIVIIRYAV